MSGRSAIAFSSRRLPMKHHGHTTSEKTSIASGDVVMVGSCIGANLCTTRSGRNRIWFGYPGDQRFHAVPLLDSGERRRGIEPGVLPVVPSQGAAEVAANAAHHV